MILVKLGGSVITDKATTSTLRHDTVDRLAAELAHAGKNLIIVHGAGSYGHILAKHHHLNQGLTTPSQTLGFAQTHASVTHLNALIIDALQQHGIPAISLPPHAILELDDHKIKTIHYTLFTKYQQNGFTPVTFGDVALDATLKGSICSGDLLMYALARHFTPEKVIFVIDEDGLYTTNPKKDPHASFIKTTTVNGLSRLSTTLDKHADVTRGMQGKIETIAHIARLGINVSVVNGNVKNRLADTLTGKQTRQTIIQGARP